MKKLIDRTKFHTYNDDDAGKVSNCMANLVKMTILERIWFMPETNMRGCNANILWFIVFMIFPWANQFQGIKAKDIPDITLYEVFTLICMILVTVLGLGWLFLIICSYNSIKDARKWYENHKNWPEYKDTYEKYVKNNRIRWIFGY